MGDFRIEGDQNTCNDGHSIFYGATFNDFAASLPLCYERSFSFICPVSPTSFRFTVTIQRGPNESGVICIVSIERTDTIEIIVAVDLWIRAVPGLQGVRVRPRIIGPVSMSPLSGVTQLVEAFIPNNILTDLGAGNMMFQASMGIHGCHEEIDVDISGPSRRRRSPPIPDDLRLLSKM